MGEDVTAQIRQALKAASIPAAPVAPSTMAAAGDHEEVRLAVGRQIASLTPGLTDTARGLVQREAVAALTALVAQAALRVRTNVAEAVRDMPDGPREIVLRLAHDPEVMVSGPVIRFSPMLTTEDLIALIASAPGPGTVTAVAQRGGIKEAVSDAVVESADTTAIHALLSNHSAQIREATLDALAAQSEEESSWREPLVRRPQLPIRAQRLLADIVTGSLLETLASRADLDSQVSRQVRQALETFTPPRLSDMRPPAALAHAREMRQAGRLDDMAILNAMRDHALVLATAMFAVRADVPVSIVEQCFAMRNARAIVALAWKAGMAMQTAVVIQAALARLPPDGIIRSGVDGTFPFREQEMRQKLTLLGIAQPGPRRWTPGRLQRDARPGTAVT
ncbi:MAG TPA: DUF2336 domain-containing protein [Rhodopila sp.]|nr:DUF2336 domain-containing protein [Rhodopila sp.]